MDTSSVDLPDELILSKCSVKSVVRFNSVSKSWRSIISDPRFSRIHRIQRSKLPENQNKFLVMSKMRNGAGQCMHLMRLEAGKLQTETVLDYSFPTRSVLPLLCSCNGLFLLGPDYALWNPSMRKHIMIRALPPPNTPPHPWLYDFYHDSVTDDHKIVFVYKNGYTVVYSCKKGRWRVCLFEWSEDGRRLQLWVMEKKKNGRFEMWRKLCANIPNVYQPACLRNEDDVVLLAAVARVTVCFGLYIDSNPEFRHKIYNPHENSFKETVFDLKVFHDDFFPFSENLYMPSASNVLD